MEGAALMRTDALHAAVSVTVTSAEDSRRGMFWLVVAFLVTFVVTRMITRLIRSGKGPFRDFTVGHVHIHHQVYGIFLMLIAGVGEFAYEPTGTVRSLLAAIFGAGAALTLDEFALWVELDDVYWKKAGRKSVDAVLIAAAIGALLVLGVNPFGLGAGDSKPAAGAVILTGLFFSFCAILKGKVSTGIIGLFVPLVSIVAALRIAKPDSPWARWRYHAGSRKELRSLRRFPPGRRTPWDRVVDMVAGAPGHH